MRETLALLRAGWLSAMSYRLNLFFSLLGLAATLVPAYFVARALQPLAANSIRTEGGDYFGFLLLGMIGLTLASGLGLALPSAIGGGVGSGTLEALLATPARLPTILLGLIAYDLAWGVARGIVMLVGGAAAGVDFQLAGLPLALLALSLTLAAYFGISLALAAMVLMYRTIGPLGSGLTAGSALLGGTYYSTSVIPSWVQQLSVVVPLTYGLRIMRRALLGGAPQGAQISDLTALAGLTLLLLACGAAAFWFGLRHARREGTLGQY